jgi:hypothetical protein
MQFLCRKVFVARFKMRSMVLAVFTFLCAAVASVAGQTSILTWHYDNLRSGANTKEVILTPANVNSTSFGKLSTKPVDGFVVAQPLYVPNVNINGQLHNVVFVATMHNSVYAFDADDTNTSPLWYRSIFDYSPAGATTVPATIKKNPNITGWSELGIVSTPVIDALKGTLYLVAETYENSKVVHRLHALDITTGVEKLGGPITIAATYTYNGVNTVFADLYQMNRPALLHAKGQIFMAWGSNGGNAPSQGWVMSYNALTLKPVGAVTLEPGKHLASIWQRGAGLGADPQGNIYAVTSEGPYIAGSNLSTSIVKLNSTNGLQLADFFTPYNHAILSTGDKDLTGLVVLPPQPGIYPREMVGIGKEGTIYLVNRDQLGGVCATCTSGDTQIIQEIPQGAGRGSGNPSFWNHRLYFTPKASPVLVYTVRNGTLVVPPQQSSVSLDGGGHCFITANKTSNAILWLINGNGIRAMDAKSLETLYTSVQAPNQRDVLPAVPHFPTPIVADGKLFVGTTNSLVTYGLLPDTAVARVAKH